MINMSVVTISGALYAAPRALEYFCTKPPEVHSRLDRLREKMANLTEISKTLIGERTWFIITDVFSKNAWISFLTIQYLTRNNPPISTAAQTTELVSAFVVFCTATAFAKHASRLFF